MPSRRSGRGKSPVPTPLEAKAKDPSLNILPDATIEAVATYIKEKKPSRILVLTGAGISTSCGIPDFRSPGTGLYDNLRKYNLPFAEAIFTMSYFRRRPEAFYALARELYPGAFRPSPCHFFIRLLADRGLLLRNYTQNIDTLERGAGIHPDRLVEAHGSFAAAKCCGQMVADPAAVPPLARDAGDSPTSSSSDDDDGLVVDPGCGRTYSQAEVKKRILAGEIPRCDDCNGLVKPDIVFFGEALPARFHTLAVQDLSTCDLVLVIGTSLQVQPFSTLIDRVPPRVPRLLINREQVGVFEDETYTERGFDFVGDRHTYRRDAVFLGDCDAGCQKLAELLGWDDDLQLLVAEDRRAAVIEVGGDAAATPIAVPVHPVLAKDVAAAVGEQVDAAKEPQVDSLAQESEVEAKETPKSAPSVLEDLIDGIRNLFTGASDEEPGPSAGKPT
ncbi:NAD-dependent protein deacetylase sirtuin-2 [Geranomyces variabilis]|uniref:NAD-dependent protein deacetylase sirtuin-2 n=1 Tax=Geranomyces variabilis TaxID=109894 RepID=A0AAD5TL51_9FUNG|nr:NAD-dependent protein deacetylase sirtuin-2 [Geranomyces variabilis]